MPIAIDPTEELPTPALPPIAIPDGLYCPTAADVPIAIELGESDWTVADVPAEIELADWTTGAFPIDIEESLPASEFLPIATALSELDER